MTAVNFRKTLLAAALLASSAAFAQKYEVKDIRIDGLEQLDPAMVFSAINLDPSAAVQKGTVRDLVDRLYATGYFKDVSVKTVGGRVLGAPKPRTITVAIPIPQQERRASVSTVRTDESDGEIYNPFGNIRTESNEEIYQAPEQEYYYEEILCMPGDPRCPAPPEEVVRSNLIIEVKEQPVLSRVTFEGNREIKDNQLKEIIASLNVHEGSTFNEATLQQARNNLIKAYESKGKYAVDVDVVTTELPRNRVGVKFLFSEGRTSQIRKINFTGNKSISDRKLIRQMRVRESSLKTFFSSRDRYNPYTIGDELEKIEEYYKNNGYMKAEVNHSAASLTRDREGVYLDINIHEGKQYRIEDVDVVGNYKIDREELMELITLERGKLYRLSRVTESIKAIQDRLGDEGYALARVNAIPRINEEEDTVSFSFAVDAGERSYVRRVNIVGNERTQDEVFRRELRQMEGGLFVSRDIERSRVRIQRLSHVEDVAIETTPVSDDTIDLTYRVKERSAGSITFGVSYGMDTKFGVNAGLSQPNFMGRGHELNIQAETDKSGSYYMIDYTDPYFTKDGLSAGVALRYSKEKHDYDNTGNYIADGISLMFNFAYPITEYTTVSAGIGYERLSLSTTRESPIDIMEELGGTCVPSNTHLGECADGTPRYKVRKNLYRAHMGIARDTRNRTIFPSEGTYNGLTLSGTIPGSDDKFYKLHYKHQSYFPFDDDENMVFSFRGDAMAGWGYGSTDNLPFYENYYAGGLRTVRGYRSSSLGPRFSNGDSKGGAFRYNASAELIMKMPGFQDNNNLRWSIFMDAGNVHTKANDVKFDEVRYSAGVGMVWISPLGPLAFSYAHPMGTKDGDRKQKFQFSIGIPY